MWDAPKAVIKEKCAELKVCSVRKKQGLESITYVFRL